MAVMTDYLDWRGDISMEVSPLNEADNFILGQVVTLIFEGIVPAEGSIGIREAAELYFNSPAAGKVNPMSSPLNEPVFRRLPDTVRFGGLVLSDYRDVFNTERTEQFCAMTISGLPGGARYIAFRETDDTLVGWKEDLLMSVVPETAAQRSALNYLREVAAKTEGPLYLGGHSKGGNLAVFAAAMVPPEVQSRIVMVYSNDGPGFWQAFLDTPGFQAIRPRVRTLVPKHSVVGTLLEQGDTEAVVKCSRAGVESHDGFYWEVGPLGFIREEDGLAMGARAYREAMREINTSWPEEERRSFIETFFNKLAASGAVTFRELTEERLDKTLGTMISLGRAPEVRKMAKALVSGTVLEYGGLVADRLGIPRERLEEAGQNISAAADAIGSVVQGTREVVGGLVCGAADNIGDLLNDAAAAVDGFMTSTPAGAALSDAAGAVGSFVEGITEGLRRQAEGARSLKPAGPACDEPAQSAPPTVLPEGEAAEPDEAPAEQPIEQPTEQPTEE